MLTSSARWHTQPSASGRPAVPRRGAAAAAGIASEIAPGRSFFALCRRSRSQWRKKLRPEAANAAATSRKGRGLGCVSHKR